MLAARITEAFVGFTSIVGGRALEIEVWLELFAFELVLVEDVELFTSSVEPGFSADVDGEERLGS